MKFEAIDGVMKLFYFIFIVISILSLALGVINYVNEKATIAAGEQAVATLTRWVPQPNYGTAGFCPVYQYTTKAGQSHSYIGDNCASQPDSTRIGSQERIYFNPKTPETVGSFGLFGSEGSGLVVGIIGFVFFLFFWIVPLLGIIILKRVLPARKSSVAAIMANPPADPEAARLAQLEREEAELKRKIEARR